MKVGRQGRRYGARSIYTLKNVLDTSATVVVTLFVVSVRLMRRCSSRSPTRRAAHGHEKDPADTGPVVMLALTRPLVRLKAASAVRLLE